MWSFIPPKQPALPELREKAWVRNPIDGFVLADTRTPGAEAFAEAAARRCCGG